MNREQAFQLLNEYMIKENLIKHCLAVEAAMRAYARKFGEDEETWGIVGLIHDFDYEKFPEEHPQKGAEILRSMNISEEWVIAILGHSNSTGVARESKMSKALFAVDELTGFITAVALMRPSRKVEDVEVSSVKKKLKDKAFAAAVSRDDIKQGAEDLGVSLDEHIATVTDAMKAVAGELGL